MQVYHGGSYGQAHLMVRPGMREPRNDHWFKLETDEHGEPQRMARLFVVSFKEGVAEVDDELGRYLLEEEQLVSAEPVPFARSPALDSDRERCETVWPLEPRKPPIAVGLPLAPDKVLVRSPW